MANKTDKLITQMINDLISLGQKSIDIHKFDRKWSMKLISSDEYIKVLNNTAQYKDELTRIYKLQVELLTYALVAINDVAFSEEDKHRLLNKLNPTMVNLLYNDFEELRSEKDKELLGLNEEEKKEQVNDEIIA